jgi:hypothetical protein
MLDLATVVLELIFELAAGADGCSTDGYAHDC